MNLKRIEWFFLGVILAVTASFGQSLEAEVRVAKGEYLVGIASNVGVNSNGTAQNSSPPMLLHISELKKQSNGESFQVAALDSQAKKSHKRKAVRYSLSRRQKHCQQIKKMIPNLSYCEPNFEVKIGVSASDPKAGSQWAISKLKLENAWDISSGSSSVVVAVIDTGVDYNHPDLAQNMWVNSGEIPGNGIDDDNNGYIDDIYGYDFGNGDSNPMDDNGHGTHVSGTIGAVGNNQIGVVGVNWQVKIMALKFLDKSGSGFLSDAVEAIQYAISQNAQVMNNSWGGGGYSQAMFSAIKLADAAGIPFIAAAGNESNNNDKYPSYPASYQVDNVISVAASARNGRLANFSNFGKNSVDVAAPGVNIMSTIPGGGYAKYSGTSMATPHISGIVALAFSLNPNLTPLEVKSLLMTSNVKKYSSRSVRKKWRASTQSGAPFIDVYQMLLKVLSEL